MLQKKKPSLPDDELTARLRAAARKPRPWSLPGAFLLLGLAFIPCGLFLWWVYPRPEPPPLEIVAFDQLALPGARITLRARLQPRQDPTAPTNLGGFAIHFEEEMFPLQTAMKNNRLQALSHHDGEAEVVMDLGAEKPVTVFVARQQGDRFRQGQSDRAKIFQVPAPTSLFMVAVQQTLGEADEDAWRRKNVLDIPQVAGAGKALREVGKKHQLVYLATGADSALLYRKVRGWVANQQAAREPFPPGPVVGRSSLAKSESQALEEILRAVRERFTGHHTVVVGTTEAAAVSRAVGLETLLIGNAPVPADVVRVKSWAEIKMK